MYIVDKSTRVCNWSVTCDSVRVIVPSLFCDIENFRDHCSGPTGQLAETQRKKSGWICKLKNGKRKSKRTDEKNSLFQSSSLLKLLSSFPLPYHLEKAMTSIQLCGAIRGGHTRQPLWPLGTLITRSTLQLSFTRACTVTDIGTDTEGESTEN